MIPANLIVQAVCAYHGIAFADLTGAGRAPQICWPRHELIYMLRGNAGLSLNEIGRLVERDGKTVQNSLNQVTSRLADDPEYRDRVQRLNRFVLCFEDRPTLVPTLLDRARRMIGRADPNAADVQACGFALLTAASILTTTDLTDAEARCCALQALGQTA